MIKHQSHADWLERSGHLDRAWLLRGQGPLDEVLVELMLWFEALGTLKNSFVPEVPDAVMLPMSTGELAVPPRGRTTICVRPQRTALQVTRIAVPTSLAPHFLVLDVKIGRRSQFQSPGPIPAEIFTASFARGHHQRLRLETVQVTQDLVLDVMNISAESRPFFALASRAT